MSNANVITQGFVADGKVFETRAAAMAHLQRPEQLKALNALTGNNAELSNWLLDNRDEVEGVLESTKIKRVTRSEKAALTKALDYLKTLEDKKLSFIADNAEAVLNSFRWPSVKRGTEEEQAATIREGFMSLTENNVALVDWVLANKDAVLESYQAGVVKREVNPKAAEALAAYRAEQAAKKAAAA